MTRPRAARRKSRPGQQAAAPGSPAIRLVLEAPLPGAVIGLDRRFVGFGWALSEAPIRSITVDLDGVELAEAETGLQRADLADLLAEHATSRAGFLFPGFMFVVHVPNRAPGAAQMRLTVQTDGGTWTHEVAVELADAVADAPVADGPAATEPLRIGLDEARLALNGLLHVRGWCVGLRPLRGVDLRLDETPLGCATLGLRRDDVAVVCAEYPNAASSGFAVRLPVPRALAGAELIATLTDGGNATCNARMMLTVEPKDAAFDGPPLLANIEQAHIAEDATLHVRGWAIGQAPVSHVRVFLDDILLGDAEARQPREDVAFAYPAYPDSVHAGFVLKVKLDVENREARGLRVVVGAADRTRLEVAAPLTRAAAVQWPVAPVQDVKYFCDLVALTEDGLLLVQGWALCPSGTAAIDIDLDDMPLGQAVLGEDRADVGAAFPHLQQARSSGFRFIVRSCMACAGDYVVRVTIKGVGGERRVLLLPVRAEGLSADAAANAPATGIRCYLDTPTLQDGRVPEPVRGFLSLNGWAFSPAGLSGIEVFVDGRSVGQAHRGIRREDLYQALDDKLALNAGFAMLIPPQMLKRGVHDVRVAIRDTEGAAQDIVFTLESQPGLHGAGPWALRRKLSQAEIDLTCAVPAACGYLPAFTLVLRCNLTDPAARAAARTTIESLRAQAWEDWSLLLPSAADGAILAEELAEPGGRVRLIADDDAAPLAALLPTDRPALLGMLMEGDELGEDALLELALAGALNDRPDFLYADDRRIDLGDGEMRAFFKPDFSPDLLLSTNYIGRMWVAAPALLGRAGLRLGDLVRHGEYDAVLRLTEHAARLHHVPKVLLARAESCDAADTERTALLRALMRRAIAADVLPGCIAGTWRVQRQAPRALVSIIIPTIGSRGLVKTAIESIRAHTDAARVEIVLLDNLRGIENKNSGWKQWFRDNADAVVEIDEAFNWSRFNNLGASAASGDMLLFLNDDIEVHDDAWLDGLLEHAARPEVGAVGPQLLYPDGKVQHAGMFLAGAVGRHAFRFSPADEPGPFGLALTQRNVISVTGACLLTRRDVFDLVGGFDEQHAVINNDLDYCLRLRRAGKLVVYTPHVRLTHHEMVSRAELSDTFDTAHFRANWANLFATGDPYYSPNLTADADDYVVEQEPARALHVGPPLIGRARVRRILALKLDHIGDFITAFPAFRRIKQHFPDAELTVLGAAASASLAPLEPAIDHFIRFDFFHAVSEKGRRTVTEKELSELAEQLAPYRFDLAIDLRRQPDTRPVLRHTGARWLAGFDRGYAFPWLDVAAEWEGDMARTRKHAHVVQSLMGFVDTVAGACEPERRLIVGAPPADARAAAAALPALSAMSVLFARPLVAIHSGAGAENKQWPPANFAALIDLIIGQGGANVVIIGGPDEAPIAQEVLEAMRPSERVGSVVGRLGLRDLPVLLRACVLYVGNDSGPKHMAAALGVPTVGIHSGSVDPAEWGPMGEAAVAVRRDMTCSPCYLAHAADCHRGLACLHGIRVGDVWRAARPLLALRTNAAASRDVAA